MKRSVDVQRRATADLVRITRFIAESVSLSSALRWRENAGKVIQSLAHDASVWPAADEILKTDVRCRIFGKKRHVYRILFTIDGDRVNVHRIRHAAQDAITDDDL